MTFSWLGIGLAGAAWVLASPIQAMPALAKPAWAGDSLRPVIFESWRRVMDSAGGVHAWSRRTAASRVFQEWAVQLADAAGADEDERRGVGEKLRRYVLHPPIQKLGRTGTSMSAGGDGDFDMTLVSCLSLLGLFEKDSLLLPNDVFVHLLHRVDGLYGQDSEHDFEVVVVRYPETENHLLMTEGCRALTNDLVMRNTRRLPELDRLRDSLQSRGVVLDNARGGLKRLLLRMMSQILRQGFFEFNARIYQRFTLHALLNLQAFASDPALREGAQICLDYLSALFALQSCEGVRWGPYRRSSEIYADSTLYDRDAVTSFYGAHSGVMPWSADPDTGFWARRPIEAGMALWAVILPYRIPPAILAMLQGDKGWYGATVVSGAMQRGRQGLPTEQYAGGPHFLLVGGGAYESYSGANFPTPGRFWQDAPWVYDALSRPAALLLAPRATRPYLLGDLLHVRGSLWQAPMASLQGSTLVGLGGLGRMPGLGQNPASPFSVPPSWGMPTVERSGLNLRQTWHWPQWRLTVQAQWPDSDRLSQGNLSPVAIEVIPDSIAPTLPQAVEGESGWLRQKGGLWQYQSRQGYRFEGKAEDKGWSRGQWTERDSTASARSRLDGVEGKASLPFAFPFWRGWEIDTNRLASAGCRGPKSGRPHVRAYAMADTAQNFVCVDGQGHFYAYHARSGAYVVANFSLWWHPLRRVYPGSDN